MTRYLNDFDLNNSITSVMYAHTRQKENCTIHLTVTYVQGAEYHLYMYLHMYCVVDVHMYVCTVLVTYICTYVCTVLLMYICTYVLCW